MGILSSVLRGLAPAAGVAGAAVQGYGQDQAAEVKRVLADRQQKRQEEQDRLTGLLTNANLAHVNAETAGLTAPKPDPSTVVKGVHIAPDGSVLTEYADGTFGRAEMRPPKGAATPPAVAAQPPAVKPEGNRFSGYNTPVGETPAPAVKPPNFAKAPDSTKSPAEVVGTPEWKAAKEFEAGLTHPKSDNFLTPEGKTVFATEEDARRLGYTRAPRAGAGGLSGQGQNMQARLLGAVSEGRLADERMSAFEAAHLKGGKLDVGTLQDVGAGLNTGLAGAHNPVSIAIGRTAGGIMNATGHSDYLQYQRDARLIARAEQLMSARGGSEAMASDNAFLASGGANAPEATVRAAQKSRKALFGQLGAVIQTLTPEQITKLNAGLAALQGEPDFDKKSALEQTLDAIDKSGLAGAIRSHSAGGAPSPTGDPEFDALMAKHRKP